MAGVITRGKALRADLANWDGRTSTATRLDATGGTITGLAIGNEVDVLQVYGAGSARTRASIADTVQQIGSSSVTLVFAPGTWSIDADLTIPSNFTCRVPSGCVFSVDSGKTLTFSGPVYAESATFYSGSGTTVLSADSLVSGKVWIKRTAAEIAAGVTPTAYNYVPLDIRRYGGVDDNSTDNATAINNAILVGGTITFPCVNTGIYRTSGAHTLADGVSFVGMGMRTGAPYRGSGLKYTGAGTMLTCVARNTIKDLELSTTLSAAPAGGATIAISMGTGAANAGGLKILRCRILNFHVGIQNGGALFATVQDCAVTANDYGMTFNMTGATTSNACEYIGNDFLSNGRGGVIGLAVPVRMIGQTFIGGAIEGNCFENTTTYPDQVSMSSVGHFSFRGVYFEYAAGGTPPNTINLANAGQGSIEDCYFNTGATHIRDSIGGAVSQVKICNNRFLGATVADINLASETDVIAYLNNHAGSVTLTGTGSKNLPTGSALASWPNLNSAFTPVLTGTGGGPPTYSVQLGVYSKTGNKISFSLRVTTTGLGGMTGPISITGLPAAAQSGVAIGTEVSVRIDGLTFSGGNTYIGADIASGATVVVLNQAGAAGGAATQIQASQIAAATTIIVSGSYQAAS